jgi:hypothetical protein
MAQFLYRNLWAPKELRTLLIGTLLVSLGFLLELMFLFFLDDMKQSFLGFLYWETTILDVTYTPLLTLFHLLVWGMIFFSSLMVYTVIREYTGARTGMSEIIAIVAVLAISTWLLFDEIFAFLFVCICGLIILYLYVSTTS